VATSEYRAFTFRYLDIGINESLIRKRLLIGVAIQTVDLICSLVISTPLTASMKKVGLCRATTGCGRLRTSVGGKYGAPLTETAAITPGLARTIEDSGSIKHGFRRLS
jgi:hypothetical protein